MFGIVAEQQILNSITWNTYMSEVYEQVEHVKVFFDPTSLRNTRLRILVSSPS